MSIHRTTVPAPAPAPSPSPFDPATSFVAALDPRLRDLFFLGFVYVYLLAQFGYIVCLQSTHCLQDSLLFLESSLHRLGSSKICCQEQHKERTKKSINLHKGLTKFHHLNYLDTF